jgi:predicted PurR-regulated permease PerM
VPEPTVDIQAVTEDRDVQSAEGRFAVPIWATDVGRWSWIIIGAGIVLVAVGLALAATRLLVLATLAAVLFGGTFLPVVDWLARHRFRRSLAAMLVTVLLVVLVILIALLIVYSVVNQVPTIEENLSSAEQSLKDALAASSVSQSTVDSLKSGLSGMLDGVTAGALGTVSTLFGDIGSLLFGIFIALNILVWLFIQGREISAWASRHMGPVPAPVGYSILANAARFLRGYLWGSTIVGLFNGVVLLVGALVIGVPMALAIAVIAWFMNYIPYFGAIVSGAFAVLIALGSGGPAAAIPMFVVVILANGFLQTLVSQFAMGSALKLHPLAVLFATTAGGLLAGAVGGVFAAPFLKIGMDAHAKIKAAGVFDDPTPAGQEHDLPAAAQSPDGDTGPPGS